jgi:hypothetical protein
MFNIKRLKGYMRIPELADHLSTISDGPVSEADIYGAALDGQLKLSVYLVNGAYAKRCRSLSHDEQLEMTGSFESFKSKLEQQLNDGQIISNTEVQAKLKEELGGISDLLLVKEDRVLVVLDKIMRLAPGVWDLPMEGNEKFDVQEIYQSMTGGAPPGIATPNGVFVTSHDGREFYQLQSVREARIVNQEIFYPVNMKDATYDKRGRMQEDAAFVVRDENLLAFEAFIREAKDALTSKDRFGTAPPVLATKNIWLEANLRTLYGQSIMPGETPEKLAVKYGISRQGIEKQIKKAKELCRVGSKPKPDPWH